MNLKPAIKGLIAAIIMIAIVLITYYSDSSPTSPLQLSIFAVYGIGIVWTIVGYTKSSEFTGKFGDSFNQGFRYFIVVTLIMVLFTAIFTSMHPEFAEQAAAMQREEFIKDKDILPTDIDEKVARYKKGYLIMRVYGSIFGYLIIGALVTAVSSLINTRRK